jgi:hypothetical protein
MDGYLTIWRSIFDTEEWRKERKFSEFEAWLDMIAMAAFTERRVAINATSEVVLSRGEIYASQRQLAQRWGWSASTVNRYLTRLASGISPRIVVGTRRISVLVDETLPETLPETPDETPVNVIKLVNYERYNRTAITVDETLPETLPETPDETIINKYIELREDKSHTHITDLIKFFVGACDAHTRERCQELEGAAAEIFSQCKKNSQALDEYRNLDGVTKGLIWLWGRFPHLQQAFVQPMNRWELEEIRSRYEQDDIERILEQMANKLDMKKRYYSASLTFKEWASRDYVIEGKRRLGNSRYNNLS